MANIDRNFLARPDFFVSTGENGQTVTLRLMPTITHTGDETQSEPLQFFQNGLASFSVSELGELLGVNEMFSSAYLENDKTYGVLNVNPSVNDNTLYFAANSSSTEAEATQILSGVYNFFNFVSKNPVHIKSINLRAENEQMIPQQIVVLKPNIFTGQSDRQIIDVASKKTAYQYQDGIITIDDADLLLCRNSTVKFNASFNIQLSSDIQDLGGAIYANPVYMDIVIDKYLSLEKALVENLKLM